MSYHDDILATSGLIAYWPFDEASGTTISDDKGSSDLTISGGASLVHPSINSDPSPCVLFDGLSGKATNTTPYPIFPVTFECWFRCDDSTQPRQPIFFNGSQNSGWGPIINQPVDLNSTIQILAQNQGWYDTGYVVDGNAHHLVLMRTGEVAFTLYIDKVLIHTRPNVAGFGLPAANKFCVGVEEAPDGTNYFKGAIKSFAVYDRELTATEIEDHYDSGMTGEIPWTPQDDADRETEYNIQIFDRHPTGPRPYTRRYEPDGSPTGTILKPSPNAEEHYDPNVCFWNAYMHSIRNSLVTTGWDVVRAAARDMMYEWTSTNNWSPQLIHHQTHGFTLDWLIEGDTRSRDAVINMQPVPSIYAEDHWRRQMSHVSTQREVAFQLVGNIDRYLCDGTFHELTLVNADILIDQLDHLSRPESERWGVYIRSFMVGLGHRSLAYLWFTFRDSTDPDMVAMLARIPDAIERSLLRIMDVAWYPRGQTVPIAGSGDTWDKGTNWYTWPEVGTHADIPFVVATVTSGKVFTGPNTLSGVDDYYKHAVILGTDRYVIDYNGTTKQFTLNDSITVAPGDTVTLHATGDEGGSSGGGHVLNPLVCGGAFLYWYYKVHESDPDYAAQFRTLHKKLWNGQRMAYLYAYMQKEYNEGTIVGMNAEAWVHDADAGLDSQFEVLPLSAVVDPPPDVDEPTLSLSPPIPSSGASGVASGNFTVAIADPGVLTVRVVPSVASGGAGLFIPSFLDLSSGTPSGTFVFVPTGAGFRSIRIMNNAGITEPSPVGYTATGPAEPPPIPADDSPRIGTAIAAQTQGGYPAWIIPR